MSAHKRTLSDFFETSSSIQKKKVISSSSSKCDTSKLPINEGVSVPSSSIHKTCHSNEQEDEFLIESKCFLLFASISLLY